MGFGKIFSIGAVVVLLTECGGLNLVNAIPHNGAERPAKSKAPDLIYVAGTQSEGDKVWILTLPDGKIKTTFEMPDVETLCSNRSTADVWIVASQQSTGNTYAFKFAHGGTNPIGKIEIGTGDFYSGACAVDPASGNLAVGSAGFPPYVAIYGSKLAGHTLYASAYWPTGMAYDDDGDLFVDGYYGTAIPFAASELPKNGGTFKNIDLPAIAPGGVAWDGKDIAIATGVSSGAAIYRLSPNGAAAVSQVVKPLDISRQAQFAVRGQLLVGTRVSPGYLDIWRYPSNQRPIEMIRENFGRIGGIALSPSLR
jgi:hypothetical protein